LDVTLGISSKLDPRRKCSTNSSETEIRHREVGAIEEMPDVEPMLSFFLVALTGR